jgi:PAS domain S-box-containing protein
MNQSPGGDPTTLLPATVAVRVTFVMALVLTTMVTVATGLQTPAVWLFWGLTGVLAGFSFWPRVPERFRAAYVCVSWFAAGCGTLWWYGLIGGSAIVVVAIALAGLFFGARTALFATGLATVVMGAAGYAHVDGVIEVDPRSFGNTSAAMWIVQTATFFAIATMVALVQSAVLQKAQAATARARHFALAVERTDSSVIITDPSSRIVWMNDAFTKMTGYTVDEAIGRAARDLLQGPGTSVSERARMRACVEAGEAFTADIVNYTKAGTPYWVRVEVRPFHDERGRLSGFTGVQSDVTVEVMRAAFDAIERTLAAALAVARRNDDAYAALAAALVHGGPVMCARVWRVVDGVVQWMVVRTPVEGERRGAPGFAEGLPAPTALPADQATPALVPRIAPIPHAALVATLDAAAGIGVDVCVDPHLPGAPELAERLPRLLGHVQKALERLDEGQVLERALGEASRSLAEREVLLKEVHHRVKNNLQIVSSLLGMQADRATTPEARVVIEESAHRVRSMALIHQLLYGGTDLARVDLGGYAHILAAELRGTLAPSAALKLDVDEANVTVEQAIPCGLILNELITNALKHGRSADGVHRLLVEVRGAPDAVVLVVADEGPGLPPDFTARRRSSLGMKIVDALVKQLGATLQVTSTGGTRFSLQVPCG